LKQPNLKKFEIDNFRICIKMQRIIVCFVWSRAMGAKFRWTLAIFVVTPVALAAAPPADFYAVPMAACVPTGQSSSQSVLFNSAGEASFREGSSGEIILTCQIPQTLSKFKRLVVRYKDDGLQNSGSQVVAAFRRKTIIYGGLIADRDSTVETVVEINTNTFTSPLVSPQGYRDSQAYASGSQLSVSLDHRKYVYYVQVNMRRPSNATGPVTVAYIALDSQS
jgi:hypothetical protein